MGTDRYTTMTEGSVEFTPERIGEVIYDTVYEQLALLQTPAVRPLAAQFNAGGNTVTFPVFEGVTGNFSTLDATDSTGLSPDVSYAEMTFETAPVQSKILDVGIKGTTLDDAYRGGQFAIVDAILEDVAAKAAKIVDSALITTAETTSLSKDVTGDTDKKPSRNNIIAAKAKWGDRMNQPAVLVLHSAQFAYLLGEVKDYNIYGSNVVTTAGTLPQVLGMPIVISDALTVDNLKYTGLIVAAGGLGFDFHRSLSYKVIEQTGDKNVHEFVMRFITKLFRRNGAHQAIKLITN